MARRIQLRRDTAANWTATNPTLAQGEIGIDLTNNKIKIGNGSTAWNSLSFFDDKETILSNYAGNIIPSDDNTYDLGSPTKQWRDIFVSEGSIYIGDIKLSNDNGTLKVQQVTDAGLGTEAPVPNTPGAVTTDRLVVGEVELVLTGGANPYVTFPAITGGDQLHIQGAEMASASGNLALTSRGDLNIISNAEGLGGGSSLWKFNAQGDIELPIKFPIQFTAMFDAAHYTGGGTFQGDGTANFTIELQGQGSQFQWLADDPTFDTDRGYVGQQEFRYTEEDHGITGYNLDIIMEMVGSGPYSLNVAFSPAPGPANLANIRSSQEIIISADTKGWLFDINGDIYLPPGGDIRDSTGTSVLGVAGTGDITFNGVKVIGAGTASGDGNGYSTLELVPDNNLYANNQYLVIDPTAPSHIHIRAGGTQDNSNADLILGGEKNYVRVNDFNGVRIQNEQANENFYYYDSLTSFTSGSWYEDTGSFYVEFTTTDQTMVNWFWQFTNGGQNRIVLNGNDTLEYGGWASNPSQDFYKVQVLTGPVASPDAVNSIEFQIFTTQTNYLYLENNDFRLQVSDDIRMYASDIFRLVNYSIDQSIEITTDGNNASNTWSFNANGTLNFPDGTIQTTAYTGSPVETDTLDSVTDRGAVTTNNITVGAVITTDITNNTSPAIGTRVTNIRPPDGAGGNNGYVWVPDVTELSSLGDITGWTMSNSDGMFSTTIVQMRYDLGTAWGIETADSLLFTGTYTFTSPGYVPAAPLPVDVNVGTDTWRFNTSGDLSIPGGISSTDHLLLDANYDDGFSVYIGNNHSSPGMLGGVVIGDIRGGFVNVLTQKLIISDTAAPTSSTGAPGDLAGQIAFDGSYIYYCTANFGGTSYNVVHNLAEGTSANGVDNGYLVANTYQLPEVGWKVYYNGEVRIIDQVNNGGIPGYYVVFVDSALVIPGQATFAWGPAPIPNIWKRVAWSGDTW